MIVGFLLDAQLSLQWRCVKHRWRYCQHKKTTYQGLTSETEQRQVKTVVFFLHTCSNLALDLMLLLASTTELSAYTHEGFC